jgi:hypothetical protein
MHPSPYLILTGIIAQFWQALNATFRLPAPRERVIQAKVPDGGNPGSDEVG